MNTRPISATGMVWYRPEDFAEIQAMMEDAHLLHRTHAEWQRAAEQGERSFRAKGGQVYRAILTPAAFRSWCSARGLKLDAHAREPVRQRVRAE